MYATVEQFFADWRQESAGTEKIFAALTDASLAQAVTPGGRTLGQMAWHIVKSVAKMMGMAGLPISDVDGRAPASAAAILADYRKVAAELPAKVGENWTDETLKVEDEMFGQRWARGLTLQIVIRHQAHHRAQMTVLMRQAGLVVPGVYGPAKEEWGKFGMEEPEE